MLFRKKRKPPAPPNPGVVAVNRIIIGFLIVSYVISVAHNHTFNPVRNAEEVKNTIEEAAPSIPSGFTDYKNFLPADIATVTFKDTKAGSGMPAVCGQDVTITYTTSAIDGKVLPDNASKDKPLTFRIGEHKVMPALEQGIAGMQKDGTRIITAPPEAAYGSKNAPVHTDIPKDLTVRFDVTLLQTKPSLPDPKDILFRISEVEAGSGAQILCGSMAKVQMTVWDMEGKKLFDTHGDKAGAVSFTTGKSEVFLGLEQAVIGMHVGGKRSMVIPPAFQKTLRGNTSSPEIPFPPKQTVLVEIKAMP